MTDTSGWHIWIDRGGTFTDIVAIDPEGQATSAKLLSENPEQYADAALEGIRRMLGAKQGAPLPVERIAAIHMGTTVATNALLERKGEKTLLVTTRGFRDQLAIGYQHRPKLFVCNIERAAPLHDRVIEIVERLDSAGKVEVPLDISAAERDLERAFADGYRSCAIVFMHGYRFTDHEQKVAHLARQIGFSQVSTSHEVSPLMKFVSRGHTTVADAYLSPVLRKYVEQVAAPLGTEIRKSRLRFMRSSGALASADHFSGKDALLSGPAGGVIGMAETARLAGFDKVIGFDMGGTSTDVSRFDGQYEHRFESEFNGIRIRAPMLAVHTVAAGGGSILFYENARMRVGPESAGANPGPASYRRGGPLTVTDANILVGRIQPAHFPKVFGPNASEALDADVVKRKFSELAAQLEKTPEETADGFLDIAVANLAEAIKKISIAEGADVSLYTLQCFGGAGAQLACRVADALGMRTIMIHPFAGVLSAFGMGQAQVQVRREAAVEKALTPELMSTLQSVCEGLLHAAAQGSEVATAGLESFFFEYTLHLRYQGTDTSLPVRMGSLAEIKERFRAAHEARFGFWDQDRTLIVESVSAEGNLKSTTPSLPPVMARRNGAPLVATTVAKLYAHGQTFDASIYARDTLDPGDVIIGPAILTEPNSTIVIDPGWTANYRTDGNIVVRKADSCRPHSPRDLQRALHVHRRADGNDPGENGLLREHQGAPRFLLRPLRRRRQSDCQRAAHAGAPGFNGRKRARRARPPRQVDGHRRRVCGQRALCGRHTPARHHRRHARVPGRRHAPVILHGRARPPRRRGRDLAGLDAAQLDDGR
jgi:5-oxoprolinase (ATP-hydrolysing)